MHARLSGFAWVSSAVIAYALSGIFLWSTGLGFEADGEAVAYQAINGGPVGGAYWFGRLLGLLWQNLAVFLIVARPLGLHWSKVVCGDRDRIRWRGAWVYCDFESRRSCWCGNRYLWWRCVLPLTAVCSRSIQQSRGRWDAFIVFLGAVLRLWTIKGELVVFSLAYLARCGGAGSGAKSQCGEVEAGGRWRIAVWIGDD